MNIWGNCSIFNPNGQTFQTPPADAPSPKLNRWYHGAMMSHVRSCPMLPGVAVRNCAATQPGGLLSCEWIPMIFRHLESFGFVENWQMTLKDCNFTLVKSGSYILIHFHHLCIIFAGTKTRHFLLCNCTACAPRPWSIKPWVERRVRRKTSRSPRFFLGSRGVTFWPLFWGCQTNQKGGISWDNVGYQQLTKKSDGWLKSQQWPAVKILGPKAPQCDNDLTQVLACLHENPQVEAQQILQIHENIVRWATKNIAHGPVESSILPSGNLT